MSETGEAVLWGSNLVEVLGRSESAISQRNPADSR